MRKMMRKVKSQWITVGLSALAVVGVGIRDVSAEDTIDPQQDSHLKDFEIQLGDTLWGNVPNYQVAIKNRASVEVIKSYGNRALYKGENGLLNGKGNFEKKIDNKGKEVIITIPAGNESPGKPPVVKHPEVAIVTTASIKETVTTPYETIYIEDETLNIGEKKVTQIGVDGLKTNTYTVTFTDGVETNRELSNSEITTAPVNEVVAIGTKVVETKVETVTENVVAFETRTQEDNTIPIGETHVVQAGSEGYDTVTYEVTYTNGIETNRVETSRNTNEPVEEIITVGTKASNIELNSDTEAPEVLNLSIEQGPVSSGDSVTVTVEIMDNKSGIDDAYVYFTAPSGNKGEVVALKRITGNTFAGEFNITEYKEIGTWNLEYVFARDNESNSRVLYADEVAEIMDNANMSIIVVDANSDAEAPEVLHLSIEQGPVSPGDSVTVTAEITDDKSGIGDAYAYFIAPSGNKGEAVALKPISGNTFAGEFNITEYKESGTWNLEYVFARDNESNSRVLYANEVATITDDASIGITVVNANSDAEAPEFLNLSVEQGIMSPGDSVTVTAEIIDNKSGIDDAYVYFTAPSGNKGEVVALKRITGNTFAGEFNITEYKESGTWNLEYIFARDNESNSKVLYANELGTIVDYASFTVGTN